MSEGEGSTEVDGPDMSTAVGYLTGVLTFMQSGGLLSDIDATVSWALHLHAQELELKAPGSLKAAVLRDSADRMAVRHNNLNADAVFRDMKEQARLAGLAGN